MKSRPIVKPSAKYTVTYLYYHQEDVLKALGVKIPKGRPISVHCDGSNKVRIEVFQPLETKEAL